MSAAAAVTATLGSQADFARAQGWQKSYVTALKKAGRLVFADDGQVLFEPSLQRIKDTAGAAERAAPQVQGKAYSDSQDRERFYNAELKRLELERETRKLRESAEVVSAVDDAAALIRSTVEAWRDRMPPQLAALGADEQRIASFLAAECEHLLQRMAEKFGALAAAEDSQR